MWMRSLWRPKPKPKFGFFKKMMLLLLVVAGLYLFRAPLLEHLKSNPHTAGVTNKILEVMVNVDLSQLNRAQLESRATQLSSDVETWQTRMTEAANEGQERFEEAQASFNQAKEALEETRAALEKLSSAGEDLKNAVTPDQE